MLQSMAGCVQKRGSRGNFTGVEPLEFWLIVCLGLWCAKMVRQPRVWIYSWESLLEVRDEVMGENVEIAEVS